MLPQSVQHGAAVPEGGVPTLEDRVLLLPPELRSIVLRSLARSLTPAAARTFASKGSAALQAVLEARTDLQSFTIHRVLATRIATLRFSARSEPTSTAQVQCGHGEWVIRVLLPWHAVPRVAAEQQHADAVVPADVDTDLFWLSPAATASALEVDAGFDCDSPLRPFALPPGMGALTTLCVGRCNLQGDWCPQSSSGSMRTLDINRARAQRLPAGMGALTELRLTNCEGLTADWLPESSRPLVRILNLDGCNTIESVPAGMLSLECIDVSFCDSLAADWLPESSRARVRVVTGRRYVRCLPTGLQALEYVSVDGCEELTADWLPQSSTASLRVVDADGSNLETLPENMPFLEAVQVCGCKHLAANWLPASSAQRVRFVDARYSNMQRLPSGMTALAVVDVTDCTDLAVDWLPDSSAADVRQLGAVVDPATKLSLKQRDRSALQTLLPLRCWPLQQVCVAAASRDYTIHTMAAYAPIILCPTPDPEPLVRSLQPGSRHNLNMLCKQ